MLCSELRSVTKGVFIGPIAFPSACRTTETSCGFSGFGDFRGGAYFLNFGACASGDVLKAGLDDHVALFAESFRYSRMAGSMRAL